MPESVQDEIGYGTSKTRPWDSSPANVNPSKIVKNRMPEGVPDEIGYGTSKTRPPSYRFWVVLGPKIDHFGTQNRKKNDAAIDVEV